VRMEQPFSTSKQLQVQSPNSRGIVAERVEDILPDSEMDSALQRAHRAST
jgi:hypothetical protein